MDVNKLKVEDIRQLSPAQLRSLSDAQLRRATQIMMNAANKRVARMMGNKIGQFSPLASRGEKAAAKGEKTFTLKGAKNRAEVKAEFDRMRDFFNPESRSNTAAGWKQIFKEVEKRVGSELAHDKEFWQNYRKLETEFNGHFPGGYSSTEAQRYVSKSMTEGQTYDNMKKYFNDIKEKEIAIEMDMSHDFADYKKDGGETNA